MHLHRIIVCSVTTLLLVACSNNKSLTQDPAAQIVGTPSASMGAAQSYAAANTSFQRDSQGFTINALTAPANQVYYFGFDQSTMRPQDLKALAVQAAYLVQHPQTKVRLEVLVRFLPL